MTHAAPETTSIIDSKSISKDGGRTTCRGLVKVEEGAHYAEEPRALRRAHPRRRQPFRRLPLHGDRREERRYRAQATVSKVGDDQLFYLMSRGLTEQQATAMIVNGFIERVTKTLPMEYAVELSRLIELNMEGSVG